MNTILKIWDWSGRCDAFIVTRIIKRWTVGGRLDKSKYGGSCQCPWIPKASWCSRLIVWMFWTSGSNARTSKAVLRGEGCEVDSPTHIMGNVLAKLEIVWNSWFSLDRRVCLECVTHTWPTVADEFPPTSCCQDHSHYHVLNTHCGTFVSELCSVRSLERPHVTFLIHKLHVLMVRFKTPLIWESKWLERWIFRMKVMSWIPVFDVVVVS